MIEHALAVVAGGVLLAWGVACGLDKRHPSLKTRMVIVDHEEGGYSHVEIPCCPDTADELIAAIDRKPKPAGK